MFINRHGQGNEFPFDDNFQITRIFFILLWEEKPNTGKFSQNWSQVIFSFKNSFKHKVFPKWNVFPKIPGSYQLDWTQLLLIVTVIAVCYCITSTLFLCQLQSAMARIPATRDPEQFKRYGSRSVGLTRLQTYHAWHLEIHHWVSIPRHRDLCSQDGQFLQLPGNLGLPSSLVHLLGSCQGGRKRKTAKFLTEACPAFKVQIVPVNPKV